MDDGGFTKGVALGMAIMFVIASFVILWSIGDVSGERTEAGRKCQALGYSAGHYEKEAGLVCEQWIEAAKVRW